MAGFVYFIATGECEQAWVKIGYTGGSPYERCRTLQTGCPHSLNVLAYAPGTPDDEYRLHRRFAAFRGYGEWFALEGSLQAYVRDLITRSDPLKPTDTLWTQVYLTECGH